MAETGLPGNRELVGIQVERDNQPGAKKFHRRREASDKAGGVISSRWVDDLSECVD